MKRFLLTLCALCATTLVWAATEVVNGITLTYSVSSSKATITDCNSDASGVLEIPDTLGGSSVTAIGDWAFSGCSGLTSVTIPEGVTSIGYCAFMNCSSLESIKLPESLREIVDGDDMGPEVCYGVFSGCKSLKTITIPGGVTSIEDWAFFGCTSLTSVTISEGVTSIGGGAFSGCSGLTSVTIPESVTSIWGSAFAGCLSLTSVTIPGGVKSIGGYAFYSCAGLTSVTISEGVTSIEDGAFYGCSGLTSITIPESVTSIGSSAFYGCSGLTSIAIPEGVTSIGDNAFSSTTKVSFSGNLVAAKWPAGLDKTLAVSVTIPEGVTSIGSYAFYNCSGLTSVTIPEGVTSIGEWAFYTCSGLTSITIPDSVTSIGGGAFYACSGLTSVTISSSVTSIEDYAFYNCSALTSIKFNGPPCSVGQFAFSGVTATAIYTGRYANRWEAQLDIGLWSGHDLTFTTEDVSVEVTCVGAGEVTTSAADGIVEYFPKGETRSLTATANEGYIFMGWSGDVVSLEPAITLTSEDTERYQLTALFLPKALIKAVAKEMIEEEKLTSDADVETAVNTIISDKLTSGALVSAEDAKASAKTEAGKVMDEKMEEKGVVTQPQLLSLAVTDEATRQLELSWQSVKGRTYTVLTTPKLAGGWDSTPYAVLEGTGERLTVLIPQEAAVRFFKVSVDLTPADAE